MAGRSMPSPMRLRDMLDYDAATGVLTWRSRATDRWNARWAGKRAGTMQPGAGIVVRVEGQAILAHRIIWAIVHGTWPECVLHRNRKLDDNRLENLRDASRQEVQRNLPMLSTNTSGVRGVSWTSKRGKWISQIKIGEFSFCLGAFDTLGEAAHARRLAELRRDQVD